MQDIFWSTFWFFLIQTLLYFFISNIFSNSTALIILIGSLILLILAHTFWIYKLNQWLDNPAPNNLPDGVGIWQNIFSKLYKNFRNQKKSKKNLTSAIDQFIQAADALLDGVITLNDLNEVIWSNKRAQSMFGINQNKDHHQPIQYIFRNTEFIKYLESGQYNQPIQVKTKNQIKDLEIKIITFGQYQKLVIAKDISTILKNEMVRKEFVSNFSHELKTPLTVILGFIETLKENKVNLDKSTNKVFTLMNDQAVRMNQLINDLLLLSNIEASLNTNRSEKIDIKILFEKIKKNIKPINNKTHKINFKINSEINLYGSKYEIESAFTNIITNAIRYTPKKGEIKINWNLIHNMPIYEVIDSGIGIANKHIDRITERFYRVDDNRSRSSGGTGLGLSIVKNIMIQHQGELKITSKINKGSSFKLIFPSDRMLKN